MPRRHCLCLVALAVSAWAAGALAATPLSESEFLARAIEQPVVRAALEVPVRSAMAEARGALTWENPIVGVERESLVDDGSQTTWSVSWRPPLDPRRWPLRDASRAAIEGAEQGQAWWALELRAELRRAYADWALAAERARVSVDLLDRVRGLTAVLSERTRAGEESGLALRRLRLAAVELEAQAGSASAAFARAASDARVRIAAAETYEPTLPPLPEPAQPQPGGAHHPLLATRRMEVEEAEHRERASRRYLSFPEVSVGFRRVREASSAWDGLVLAGSVPLPLFDRRQADRVEAQGGLTSARARLDREMARIDARRLAADETYRDLREAAVSARTVIAESEAVIESATARFRMGEGDLTELLETLRGVLSSRLAWLDLYENALEAHRELELAGGRPQEEEAR